MDLHVNEIHNDIDSITLEKEVFNLIQTFNLHDQDQISLTSIDGNNDWKSSTGKIRDLHHPERYFSEINNGIKGTLIEECISRYNNFYRWRIMKVIPNRTYSVHQDGLITKDNIRLHIPVATNDKCFLCFYDSAPEHNMSALVKHYHLECGKSFEVDTTRHHTAVNYGKTDRYHIVGVRYENSNYRS